MKRSTFPLCYVPSMGPNAAGIAVLAGVAALCGTSHHQAAAAAEAASTASSVLSRPWFQPKPR
jgi:hypothetical protein